MGKKKQGKRVRKEYHILTTTDFKAITVFFDR